MVTRVTVANQPAIVKSRVRLPLPPRPDVQQIGRLAIEAVANDAVFGIMGASILR